MSEAVLEANPATHTTWPTTFWPMTGQGKPIRRTLAEIESLRKAAQGDKALAATLRKFAPFVEVVVSFE